MNSVLRSHGLVGSIENGDNIARRKPGHRMTQPLTIEDLLEKLNPQQREAATHGDGPLLIVAGAGTGKTATLVHRVAWLIARGVDPGRILLLTFTRRAAAEMLRRVENLLRHCSRLRPIGAAGSRRRRRFTRPLWGGTFHAVATRLLRRYGKAIGLPPGSRSTTGPTPRT